MFSLISRLENLLWGNKAKLSYLFIASILLLFTLLNARELWTQEHRWADIVSGMLYHHDYLHPYLRSENYYDKPLLSYWLMVIVSYFYQELNTWSLRIPSALAGLLSIWSIYQLGIQIKNKQLGFLAAWMLLTTFYFVFWSRTSSADMLNLAGSFFAVTWYFTKREQPSLTNYTIFFTILALTSLCKGLIGAIIPMIAIATHMFLENSWKKHINFSLVFSIFPAIIIYLSPFIASIYFNHDSYQQNGLYLVYRENILRYFQPFDHQDPIYSYFIYLPIYLLPWTLFFIPALFNIKSRWKNLSMNGKWIAWTLLALFVFLTISGSRRNYYVLPLIPYAILFTAEWLLSNKFIIVKRLTWVVTLIAASYITLFIFIDLFPAWTNTKYGIERFTTTLKQEASKIKPWSKWRIVMLDAESKLTFYLNLSPDITYNRIKQEERHEQAIVSLLNKHPELLKETNDTIFITRKMYLPALLKIIPNVRVIETPTQTHWLHVANDDKLDPVALISN